MIRRNQSTFLSFCFIGVLLITPFQILKAKALPTDSNPVFSFGIIPQFKIHRMLDIWTPVIQSLEKISGLNIRLVIPNSIPEFEERLLSGEFDFAYMNPYEIILSNKTAGYTPIAFDRNRRLQGVIVVKKNSAIESISQLDKKEMAFPSFNALGASLLIRAELKDEHQINVNSHFLRTHDSVYLNVVQGHSLAGGGTQKTLAKQPPLLQNKLKIIYQTQSVAAHPFAVHPKINEKVSQRFYQALHSMSLTHDGLKKLKRIPVSSISPAKLSNFKPLADMNLDRFYKE